MRAIPPIGGPGSLLQVLARSSLWAFRDDPYRVNRNGLCMPLPSAFVSSQPRLGIITNKKERIVRAQYLLEVSNMNF